MSKGSILIYTSAAGQAAPLPGVTLTVTDAGGSVRARLVTDADGFAEAAGLPAPDAAYSLDEANSAVRPYAIYSVEAVLDGWQTVNSSESIGSVSLLHIGVVYFLVRIIGKYAGAFIGCAIAGKSKLVRNYLGLALIPQDGVAIGLAAMGARTLGGETGNILETVILASSVLYELIGPACAKLSLYLSKSYSNKLEEIVEIPEEEEAEQKTELELLIQRIQAIQEELPKHDDPFYEDEKAFSEAAEEHCFQFNEEH